MSNWMDSYEGSASIPMTDEERDAEIDAFTAALRSFKAQERAEATRPEVEEMRRTGSIARP